MIRYIRYFIIALILLAKAVMAQAPPNHGKVFFSDPLTTDGSKGFGNVVANDGSFDQTGWTPTDDCPQMRIDLKNPLPPEGTLEVKVSGYMPQVLDDWVPLSMWSRPEGNFHLVDPTPGSYAFIKTESGQLKDGKQSFRFFTCPFYGGYPNDYRRSSDMLNPPNWDPSKEYTFKFIWNQQNIWFLIDGQIQNVHPFQNTKYDTRQVEGFLYIFLNKDNRYNFMLGPTYRDLTVYVPDADIMFRNVSKSTNAWIPYLYGGQAVSFTDVNADGLEDIYVTICGSENKLFVQQQNGTFAEEAMLWNIADGGCSFSGTFADYDLDGDNDLFVGNLYEENRLYINNGSSFVDKSFERGLPSVPSSTAASLAIDVENDGDLDIYVSNSSEKHQLLINDGSGNFSVRELTVAVEGDVARVAAGDLNLDGYVDIVYTRRDLPVMLFINDGNGNFTDQAASWDLQVTARTNSPTLFDYDNDGDMDLLISIASSQGDIDPQVLFFENDEGNRFIDKSDVIDIHNEAFGVLAADFNNDGYVDLFFPRRGARAAVLPDVSCRLYLNNADGTFSEMTGTGAEVTLVDGRGSSFADFNNDGLLDIYIVPKGGEIAEQEYGAHYLFENATLTSNQYLQVSIRDTTGQIMPIGSKLYVYQAGHLGQGSQYLLGYRELYPWQGYQAQISSVLHFGVGQHSVVDLKVVLPDGKELVYPNLETNQHFVVRPYQSEPYRIEILSGETQSGNVNDFLSDSVVVKVLSAEDKPVISYPVRFEIIAGGGGINAYDSTEIQLLTNQYGLARIDWKLGTVAGVDSNRLRISCLKNGNHLVNSPRILTATAIPDDPYDIEIVSGNNQTAKILQPLPDPLTVRVVDQFRNPIENHSVTFKVDNGNGYLEGVDTLVNKTTGIHGQAAVIWTLGRNLGLQQAKVESEFNGQPLLSSPLTFSATGEEPDMNLYYVSGDRQTGVVNQSLSEPFVVQLADMENKPIAGQEVTFGAITDGGKFTNMRKVTVETDASGRASAFATLGVVAGDTSYVYHASVTGAKNSPIVFKASARAGSPTQLKYVSGNKQSHQVGQVLDDPLVVQVLDAFENPVALASVTYRIHSGDGSFNGADTISVTTNKQGYAPAYLKLGATIGQLVVRAHADGVANGTVTFDIEATAGNPAYLQKVSGDYQKGEIGEILSSPFVVMITDSFANPLADHPVIFEVIQGGGSINGYSQYTALTDANGHASAYLVMGTTHYLNEVSVISSYNGVELGGSPLLFRATSGAGEPDSLKYVSGNYQIGQVNQPLPQPIRVRVVDSNGIPIESHPVEFLAFSGANFSGKSSLTVETNSDGFAMVRPSLGSSVGENNYIFEVRAYNENRVPLKTVEWPLRLYASGRLSVGVKMVNMTPHSDQLSGTVGEMSSDTLKVKILDKNNQPAGGQPVVFKVTEGEGGFEDGGNSRTVLSNQKGIAFTRFKHPKTPGDTKLESSANDGVNELQNSPISFSISTRIGEPDPSRSIITHSDSAVIANGVSAIDITVTVVDLYGNPISGKNVTFVSEGINVSISQPQQPTDNSGRAMASVTSNTAGEAHLWALVEGNPVPNDTVHVRFHPGPPSQVFAFGIGQTVLMDEMLAEPVGVVVKDQFGNPVANVPVTITVAENNGFISEQGPFYTNVLGRVAVHWTVGKPGEQHLYISVPSVLSKPLDITTIALAPDAASIQVISGREQTGLINTVLEDSFKVLVLDKDNEPIPSLNVSFILEQGDGVLLPNAYVKTNSTGYAAVLYKPGMQTGMHQIRVNAVGLEQSVIFQCIIQNELMLKLEIVSGNGQMSRPGILLPSPLRVRVKDAFNNLMTNTPVIFQVISGEGSIAESQPVMTDQNGIAQCKWRLGPIGEQRVQVLPATGSSDPVYFIASIINSAPDITTPGDIIVNSGQLVRFDVTASDPDQDAVIYKARQLPDFALFDSTKSVPQFSWYPSKDQTGDYTVIFIAEDIYGMSDTARVKITVNAFNQRPVIQAYTPLDTTQTFQYGSKVLFQVIADDPDDDKLGYEWRVNDSWAGDTTFIEIIFNPYIHPAEFVVNVRVQDKSSYTEMQWHIKVKTTVELSSFTATESDGRVKIQWTTSSEKYNRGFNLLKSRKANSSFGPLNSTLIEPNIKNQYHFIDTDVQAGETLYYILRDIDQNGMVTEHGPVSVTVSMPKRMTLGQNYPNPFNPTTTISFDLPEMTHVRLSIYNISGQCVDTLCDEVMNPGRHEAIWDGRDGEGTVMPSGVYYYRLISDQHTLCKKLVLMK
ncbi:T9SS type A sorting domain-containing protein [candidate division KSB1 bacterium]|nr:T9SS type A sorting domain-containing protein [candidate division KSB1 bacterium]